MRAKNKGITLVALVITIIICLILFSVTIQMIRKSNLENVAKSAREKTEEAYRNESTLGNEVEIDGKTYAGIEDYIESTKPLPKGAGKRVPANATFEYQSNGKTAIIPGGFTVSGVPSEASIDGGLVIYLIDKKEDGTVWTDEEIAAIDWTDGTTVANLQKTYDQFVWIPIARENINDMYMCQNFGQEGYIGGCNITVVNDEATCTAHNNCTAMAGYLYTNTAMTSRVTSYTADSGRREPDVVINYDYEGSYLTQVSSILGTTGYDTTANFKKSLQNEYNDIVKSVYESKGFYVGRYETSGMVNSNTNATIKVVAGSDNTTNAKIGSITWYRMYAQQKKYAENKGLTNVVGSTMIQGAAYDQVMKFVNTASYSVTTAGNVAHGSSQGITGVYQTGGLNYSGSVTYNDVSKNIYDLEGNVTAWTTEADGINYRVYRGGDCSVSSSASHRNRTLPYGGDNHGGSMSQLYITL